MKLKFVQASVKCVARLFKSTTFVLCCGYVVGLLLCVLYLRWPRQQVVPLPDKPTRAPLTLYGRWMQETGHERTCLSADFVSYGNTSTSTSTVKSHFGLNSVAYPYPGGSWDE